MFNWRNMLFCILTDTISDALLLRYFCTSSTLLQPAHISRTFNFGNSMIANLRNPGISGGQTSKMEYRWIRYKLSQIAYRDRFWEVPAEISLCKVTKNWKPINLIFDEGRPKLMEIENVGFMILLSRILKWNQFKIRWSIIRCILCKQKKHQQLRQDDELIV